MCDNKHGVDCVGLLCCVGRRLFACFLQQNVRQIFHGGGTWGFSTSVVSRLRKQHRHNGVLKAYKDAEEAASTVDKCKKWPETTRWLKVDDQLFTMVEDEGF